MVQKATNGQITDESVGIRRPAANICFVCGRTTTAGITIIHEFLCTECEYDMTVVRTSDAQYDFYRRRWAEFWQTLHEQAVPPEGSVPGTVV